MTFVCDNFVQSINFVWQLCFNSNPLLPKTNSVFIHDKNSVWSLQLRAPQVVALNYCKDHTLQSTVQIYEFHLST